MGKGILNDLSTPMGLLPDPNSPVTLSLSEVASWQFKELAANKPEIIAGIPSLQRGAVWSARQVELVWDSILRGFPIGALVVCKKLPEQGTRSGIHGSGWPEEDVQHHLLDGQQRCNAIALGFVDATKASGADVVPATLWIDLSPDLLKGSTRQFLLRMLTTAHPWGYTADDTADFIGVAAIRQAVEEYGSGKRPEITASWPHMSRVPIPFAWLTRAVFGNSLSQRSLWSEVLHHCREFKGRRWADEASELILKHLDQTTPNRDLLRIEKALRNASQFRMVALQVPQETLNEQSRQEEADEVSEADGSNRIYNVEHLFQRLNGEGTELRGEELLFSMIKAYWPNIEQSFDCIKDDHGNHYLPMPQSRLATLSARAAMIGFDGKDHLPSPFSIRSIRALALATKDEARAQRTQLEQYLGIAHIKAKACVQESDLHSNLRQIDDWLLYDTSSTGDYGLPPVLRASLAQEAPDVFLLLLHLAQRVRNESVSNNETTMLRKSILGLVTALHWFGENLGMAAERLYAHFSGTKLSPECFAGVLGQLMQVSTGGREVVPLVSPAELDRLVPKAKTEDEDLAEWSFWTRIIEVDSSLQAVRERDAWPLLYRVINCRAMLLYAQRAFLSNHFSDFDPSCIDIWKGHNRPWDYDHILPSAVLNCNQGEFREACREWSNTIANFRAWPLEMNRSRHDEAANQFSEDDFGPSIILNKDECDAFSLTWNEVGDRAKAAGFMNAARSRILRIYSDWFNSLDIARLISNEGTTF